MLKIRQLGRQVQANKKIDRQTNKISKKITFKLTKIGENLYIVLNTFSINSNNNKKTKDQANEATTTRGAGDLNTERIICLISIKFLNYQVFIHRHFSLNNGKSLLKRISEKLRRPTNC